MPADPVTTSLLRIAADAAAFSELAAKVEVALRQVAVQVGVELAMG